MPKLPRGMVKRGKAFYFRKWEGKRDLWIPLGSDYGAAYAKYRVLKKTPGPLPSMTVGELAMKWLGSYVATMRTRDNGAKAAQRIRDYLEALPGPETARSGQA